MSHDTKKPLKRIGLKIINRTIGPTTLSDVQTFMDTAVRVLRSRAGGKTTGENRKQDARDDAERIREAATRLLNAEIDPREISGKLIAEGFGSRPKILRALGTHPRGLWPTKK
jgi:hypothetical protein